MNTIDHRYDFVLLFDVADGNPNGDPDAGNQPRLDPETGHGIVTDVCLKRKIRNYVLLNPPKDTGQSYEIYVKERGILAHEQRRAYVEQNLKASDRPNDTAKEWMCKTFYDVRTFGAVMSTGKIEDEDKKKFAANVDPKVKKPQWNCGQVRGPVQLTFARSIDPVLTLEHSITRVALTNPSDVKRESEAGEDDKATSGQMGRKNTIPYGLYRAHGFISPSFAAQTGFSQADLDLLWKALVEMFEHDRSAARGLMATRRLFIFEHESKLGNAPAHVLFDKVVVKRKDTAKPPRSFADYIVEGPADNAQVVPGVTCHVRL